MQAAPPKSPVGRIEGGHQPVLLQRRRRAEEIARQILRAHQIHQQDFTKQPLDNGISISMDGKAAWRDNVFVERLWRSIKYEEVYLRVYESVSEARASIGRYLDFYNRRRPHSGLDRQTQDQAYFDNLPQSVAA